MTTRARSALLIGTAVMSVAAAPAARRGGGGRTDTAAVTVRLTPDSISGVRGIARSVALEADLSLSTKFLGSYAATVTWDSTVVRLDSVRAGVYGSPLVNYVHAGEVRLTQVNTSGRTGTFSLAQLYYRIVNDTVGKRTTMQLTVNDLTATDFADLRTDLEVRSGVARILPPTVLARFNPDSLRERVDFKYSVDLTADFAQSPGIALGSYTARIVWDSTVMRLDSIRPVDFTAPAINALNAAELLLTAADAQGRGGSPFGLARLFFQFVGETYPRESPITLTVTEMHAALSFANLLPGTTALNGKAIIGGVLRGDIDLSGSVAALDAQVILQAVVGLPLPAGARDVPHGDADCNTQLRARDAQIVLNHVVGNDVAQFCAGKIQ